MNDRTGGVDRRGFVRLLTGLVGACLLRPGHATAGADRRQVLRKAIPASGELLPVIGMGTSRTFDTTGNPTVLGRLGEVLGAFFEHGGTVIDSSPMYGASERVLGELFRTVRPPEDLFAATKVWTDGRESGVRQMENSRRLWGVGRFDLMQIHNLRDWRIHYQTLSKMKSEGRIRYLGITTSHGRDHDELESLLRSHAFDFVQFSYNIDNREAERRLLPLAADLGIAVLVNRPFARGGLFRKTRGRTLPDWAAEIDCQSWGQFFLKYLVSHPAVTCAIPATSKVHHMTDNMGAGVGRLPDAAMRRRMESHFGAL